MKITTDWLHDAKWGVFLHYLDSRAGDTDASPTSSEVWNARVDAFDVELLAGQLASVGAGYVGITLGQNSGHYCSPNATYDSFVGIEPSKCSRRDLIADLSAALEPKGIRLLTYLPAGAPDTDTVAMEKLRWERGSGKRLAEFQVKWEAVIREWSERWGDKVAGWWVDGVFFADDMYRHDEAPNFASLAAALKAGNPNSIVAFNPGIQTPVVCITEHEDYTAGEVDFSFPVATRYPGAEPINAGRWVKGPNGGEAQFHILSFLGEWWGKGPVRFSDEFVVGYTRDINALGGVVTWDVPVADSGAIPDAFLDQLALLPNDKDA